MLKNLIPDIYVNSISDIDLNKLKAMGITSVISDLDNTLDSHETKVPSSSSLAFLNSLKDNGFKVCIISNGKKARVRKYLEGFDIPYIAEAGKPLKRSYLSALSAIGSKASETVFIGDQIFTDTWGANKAHLTTVLVEPIKQFENSFFYIKRALERFVKARITKE